MSFKSTISVSIIALGLLILGGFFILQQKRGPLPPAEPVQELPAIKRNNLSLKELIFTEDAKNHQVIVLSRDGKLVKRIRVGKEPHDIAVSPDQKFLATGNFGDGTVSIINTKTLSIEKTIKTGKGAHGVFFNPQGGFLFVANAKDDTLSIIETTSFTQQEKIKIGSFPEYVGATKDGSKIFTTNLKGAGSITILENKGFKSKVIKTINLGIDPHGWTVSPDGSKVIITNLGSNFTYILNAETFNEIGHIDTGAATEFAAFRSDAELWVTDIGAHYISIIDIEKNEVLEKIEVGETPHGISFSKDKSLAFVPLYKPGELVIIDVAKRKVINRIKIGEELHNSVVVNLNGDER